MCEARVAVLSKGTGDTVIVVDAPLWATRQVAVLVLRDYPKCDMDGSGRVQSTRRVR